MRASNFGEFLKVSRKRMNFTLADIEQRTKSADDLYISSQYLSSLENNDVGNVNIQKVKYLGEIYQIKNILTWYCCLEILPQEDLLLCDYIIEYIKVPESKNEILVNLKRSLLEVITVLNQSINIDKEDLTYYYKIKDHVENFIKKTVDHSKIKASTFFRRSIKLIDNSRYICCCIVVKESAQIDFFKDLDKWFAHIIRMKVPTDLYIVTNNNKKKDINEILAQYKLKYFSSLGTNIYVLDEKEIGDKVLKSVTMLVLKNDEVKYHLEIDNKFQIVDENETSKLSECERIISNVKSKVTIPWNDEKYAIKSKPIEIAFA